MDASSICNKTVFVLDHSHWMRESSHLQVEIDWGSNSSSSSGGGGGGGGGRGYFSQFIPPVTKSLWTAGVETVLEYGRVVTDLFANERLLRVGLVQGATGSGGGKMVWLNNWDLLQDGVQQQSISFFAEKLGNAGPPPMPPLPHAKSNVSTMLGMKIGIKAAIEALAQPTPAQEAFMQGHGKSSLKAINKGRIICLTSLTPLSVGKGDEDLEEFFATAIAQHNTMVAPASDHLLPILECEFVLISIHPVGKAKFSSVMSRESREIPPVAKCEIHAVDAENIVSTMMDLCVSHHELVSTVVTGIPMKEEQNAQHSSNYDVKLWHPRMLTTTSIDNQILRWASPLNAKTGGLQLNHCISAVRITPVDVNGRPTTCLTSFLMNGRSVFLETLKKGKTTSHLLTSHGGEMWLHVIETARNVLEDPPSISEGVGGRVTDYRIPDFADLIRMNMLIPFPKNFYENIAMKPTERESGNPFIRRRSSASAEDLKKPLEMSKDRLVRKSSFWPMVISGSLLFPMAVHIDSLLRLMPQDKMSDLEQVECNKCIWSLMSVEARNEAPIPSGHHHKKGQKREEQWRSVYNELENFIRANQHSENHRKVLENFLESRRADSKIDSRGEDKEKSKQKGQDVEKALASLANFGTSTIIATTDSPASPPPTPTTGKSLPEKAPTPSGTTKTTLLDLWTAKTEKTNFRVLTNTKLYSHLSKDNKDGKDGDNASNSNGKTNSNVRKGEAASAKT